MPSAEMNRVLKIGLVQDGKLIEDSTLGDKAGVTIGLDPSNTLSIAEPNIPRRHMLLEHTNQGYKLNILEGMTGRLQIDYKTMDFAEAIKSGLAKKAVKGYEIVLAKESKGKITVGRSTVLFQLVPPPPPPPIMQLPKELKAGLFRNFDLFFMVVLLISALLHTSLILYLNSIPLSDVDEMPLDAERFIQVVQAEDIVMPEEEEEPEDEEVTKKPGGGGGGGGGADKGVENRGILALITRAGAKNGTVADLLSDSGLGGNLEDALNSIGGVRVGRAGDEGIGSGTRGSGAGGTGSGSGVGIGDIGSIGSGGSKGTGSRTEHKVSAKMSTKSGGVSGKIDKAAVSSTIRRYLGGVRHCYEMQLRVNPSLKGTVRIQFIIGSSGAVSGCSVTSDSMGNTLISSCVCRRVQRWRFPPPDEGTVTVSYSFVFTPAE